MKTVFAGERGSFAELAAWEYFGTGSNLQQVLLFEDVFKAVKNGRGVRGIVPIDNTRAGSVHQNYDYLVESGLHIVGELYLKISQCLIANRGVTLPKINKVYSHPHALAQCRHYLAKHPKIVLEDMSNTAAAVKKIKEEALPAAAAIASMQAAIDFDMQVLAENIQDDKENTTRFIILAPNPLEPKPADGPIKSSIVFSMKNIPGSLFKCISSFALRDIDLYKIESRPIHGQGFQYLFYLDFEGDARSEAQAHALSHLQEVTTYYRFLGSYPRGRTIVPKYVNRT